MLVGRGRNVKDAWKSLRGTVWSGEHDALGLPHELCKAEPLGSSRPGALAELALRILLAQISVLARKTARWALGAAERELAEDATTPRRQRGDLSKERDETAPSARAQVATPRGRPRTLQGSVPAKTGGGGPFATVRKFHAGGSTEPRARPGRAALRGSHGAGRTSRRQEPAAGQRRVRLVVHARASVSSWEARDGNG